MGSCRLLSLLLVAALCLLATLVASAPLPQEASSAAPEARAFGQPFDEVVVGTTLQVRPRSNSGRGGRRLETSSTEGSGVAIGEARARRSSRSRRQAVGPAAVPPPFPPFPGFPPLPSSSVSQAGAQSFRLPGGLSSDVSYSAAYSAGPSGFRVAASFSYTAPDGARRRFVYG